MLALIDTLIAARSERSKKVDDSRSSWAIGWIQSLRKPQRAYHNWPVTPGRTTVKAGRASHRARRSERADSVRRRVQRGAAQRLWALNRSVAHCSLAVTVSTGTFLQRSPGCPCSSSFPSVETMPTGTHEAERPWRNVIGLLDSPNAQRAGRAGDWTQLVTAPIRSSRQRSPTRPCDDGSAPTCMSSRTLASRITLGHLRQYHRRLRLSRCVRCRR